MSHTWADKIKAFIKSQHVAVPIHTPAAFHPKQATNIQENVGVKVSKSVRHPNCINKFCTHKT